jgi:hypothetical protein
MNGEQKLIAVGIIALAVVLCAMWFAVGWTDSTGSDPMETCADIDVKEKAIACFEAIGDG